MSIEATIYVRRLRLHIPARKLLLLSLADRADEQFSCFPSIPLLAAECEIKPRQVQTHLSWLRQSGYISDRPRFRANGSQTSNRWYIHGPWDRYGGTGVAPEEVVLPEYTTEQPFRKGTRAAGGVQSSASPRVQSSAGGDAAQCIPPVQSSASPPRTPVHRAHAAERTGVVQPSAPLEPSEEPSGDPSGNRGVSSPPSVGTAEVPRARTPQGGAEEAINNDGRVDAVVRQLDPRLALQAAELAAVVPSLVAALDSGHTPGFVRDWINDQLPPGQIRYRDRFITARLAKLPPARAERPRIDALAPYRQDRANRLPDDLQAQRGGELRALLASIRNDETPPAELAELVDVADPGQNRGQLAVPMPDGAA